MTRSGPSLAQRLLEGGVPPSLLIDLLDPEGMRAALAAELLASDVAQDAALTAVTTALRKVLRTA